MRASAHFSLLVQGVVVWALFWLAGLPSYYQQYSQVALAVGCILLTVATSLAALFVLLRGRPQSRLRRATWISFYYTVPFAILDSLYCGVYLGLGFGFLFRYWYLTVFYLVPWLTFVPTALLLGSGGARQSTELPSNASPAVST